MGSRYVHLESGAPAAGVTAVVYIDAAATMLAGIRGYDGSGTPGAEILGSEVITDVNGLLPLFWFPAGVDRLYVRVNGGVVIPIDADYNARIDQISIVARQRRSNLWTPVRPAALMISTFQSGHGWTVAGAASFNLNDTTDFVLGSQSAKMVTDTAGTVATLSSPTTTGYDLTARYPRLLVKVNGRATQASLRFYASDATFSAYRNFNLGNPEARPTANFIKEGEWTWVTLNWLHASVTGGDPRAHVERFRISAQAKLGYALTVHVGAVTFVPEQSRWPNGVVSICFDDGRASPFVNAKPKLDALGWAATAYPIVDKVGVGSYVTVAQLQQTYYYSGWEIGVHASTGARHDAGLDALTPQQLEEEIALCQSWLAANNLGHGEGIAWPLGQSTKLHEDVAGRLCCYGRGNVTSTRETWPPPLPMRIRSVAVSNTSSLSLIQGYVNEAKASKSWLCLTFHEITTPGTSAFEWPTANFNSLMDYIKAQGCAVLPVGDVIRNAGVIAT
jgi:hypothetical protein